MNSPNKYDPFEKMIQKKIDSMGNSYNQSWENISKKLDKIDRRKKIKKWGLISILSFGLISFLIIGVRKPSTETISSINKNKKTQLQPIIDSSHKIGNVIEPIIKTKYKQITHNNNNSISEKNTSKIDNNISESTNFIEDENTTNKEDEILSLPVRNNEYIIEKNESIIEKSDSVLIISTNSINLCVGDTLEFSISSCKSQKLEWYVNNKFHSHESNGKFILDRPGTLKFDLRSITEKDTLISNSIEIIIEDLSDLKISFQKTEENQMTKYYFNALSSNNLDGDFYWDFGNNKTSIEKYAENFYQKNGTYNVSLDYTSKFGCNNKVFTSIDVLKKTNLLAPNSFTPNADGINDFFMPEALKTNGKPFTLKIYNKNGQLIFESKNASNQWDGINQNNGQKCKIDNYIWLVNTINDNGEAEQFQGTILILKN
ncbi:MAG: hypothetical protein CL846_03190 [Crocinitomicaceae bacterium]|nr:hypothetical protein [Crocinitomicaceae bacterium]